jgi:Signal transduction histidine kinase regulating C4-dicarboxylate transport system
MGQLTASITHEVNQPITAAVTYALAARRFLSADPPNFREVDDALSLIVKEGIAQRGRRASSCAR